MSNSITTKKTDKQSNKMGFFKRILGIIFCPEDVMQNLVNKPRILFPIFMILLSTPVYYLLRLPLFTSYYVEKAQQSLIGVSEQEYISKLYFSAQGGIGARLTLESLVISLLWLAGSLILFLLIKAYKGKGTFKQTLSITGYSYVIILLFIIIQYFTSFITNQLFLDASFAGIIEFFNPGISKSAIYPTLQAVNIFSIWQYCVIAIGIYHMSKLNRIQVNLMMGILYILNVWTF